MGRQFLIYEFLKYVSVYFKHRVLRLLLRPNSTLTINIRLITRKEAKHVPRDTHTWRFESQLHLCFTATGQV